MAGGRPRTYKTGEEFYQAVESYLNDCKDQGVWPDEANMMLSIGILSRSTLDRYEHDEKDTRYKDALVRARAEREGWLSRHIVTDPKVTQGILFALKQPRNGGWIDRQQVEASGQMGLTIKFGNSTEKVDEGTAKEPKTTVNSTK